MGWIDVARLAAAWGLRRLAAGLARAGKRLIDAAGRVLGWERAMRPGTADGGEDDTTDC